MSDSAIVFLLLPGLFLCIVLFIEIGRRVGTRRVAEETERVRAVLNSIETAIYALLGLMIAFTFSAAASRFDTRRNLTVEEANAIGTAYLRLDLVPATAQAPLREKFRRYTEARIAVYQALPDLQASNEQADRARALQAEIWSEAVAALKQDPHRPLRMLNTQVVIDGNMALLTYDLVTYHRDARGVESVGSRWNSTTVFRRRGDAWKTLHSHWSFTRHPAFQNLSPEASEQQGA